MRKYYHHLLSLPFLFISDNCDQIKGKYFSKVDQRANISVDDNFEIVVGNSSYVKKYANGKTVEGKILKDLETKKIILEDFQIQPVRNDSLAIPWSPEVLEILECKNDTIKFRTRFLNNLHLTRLTGILVRGK